MAETGLLDHPGRVHPAAREALLAALDDGWADPTRLHHAGRRARALLDDARATLAGALGVRPDELVLTPSVELALSSGLAGLRYAARRRGDGVAASAVEQAALLRTVRAQEAAHVVPVDESGRVDVAAWADAVGQDGVTVAALQTANAEVGTRQPVAEAAAAAAASGASLLVDASASLGRAPDLPAVLAATTETVSAARTSGSRTGLAVVADPRAWGAPAGLGLLAVTTGTRFQLPGERQPFEAGRATVPPPLVPAVAAAAAWRAHAAQLEADAAEARELIAGLRAALADVPGLVLIGDPEDRLPHVLTLCALYLDGERLVQALDAEGLAVASGSACTSDTLEPSHVLAAMGAMTHGNIRVTLPPLSCSPGRADDVARLAARLPEIVTRLRKEAGVDGL